MKATIYTLMFLAVTASAPAQDPAEADKKAARSIRWRESYAKALEESRSTTRPLLIDFEADWCGWCKKLDRETFEHPGIHREEVLLSLLRFARGGFGSGN